MWDYRKSSDRSLPPILGMPLIIYAGGERGGAVSERRQGQMWETISAVAAAARRVLHHETGAQSCRLRD